MFLYGYLMERKQIEHFALHTTDKKAATPDLLLVLSELRSASYRLLARDECSFILDIKAILFGSSLIIALPGVALASGFDSARHVIGGRRLVGMPATADPWLQVPEQVSQEAFGANDEAR
jgi:hypothetical protein